MQTIIKNCIADESDDEPLSKIMLKYQNDLVDLFYGEIKEMYSKNEMSKKEIEKL